jgi:formylglycine-generating enzyme required for sulfatase activity
MYTKGDTTHLLYSGSDLVDDMIAVYDREAAKCSLSYTRTNRAPATLSYEDARKRLFLISFDPYQCVERRWGATDPQELSSCRDDATKRDWYVAEQNLRNQIDRTYDARMDFSLAELATPGPGKGVAAPPDTDARAYLLSVRGTMAPPPSARTAPAVPPAMTVAAASPPSTSDLDGWRNARTAKYALWRSGHGYPTTEATSDYSQTERPYGDGSRNPSPSRDTDPPGVSRPANAAIWDDPEAPEMMVIRAGSFIMGSPPNEIGRRIYEGPQHRVEILHPFALSRDLVTFNEWDACAAEGGCRQYHPSDQHWGRGEHPVINVSWNDAQNYIAWLNAKTGKSYRLPSEAEWEYAARAGTTTPYYQGYTLTTDQANYDGVDYPRAGSPGIYRQATTPVGSFSANGFGLTDMEGNVWEWAQDCWNADYRAAHMPTDGAPWMSGDCDRRVVRAGAFNTTPAFARSAYRFWEVGQLRSAFIGFRVARNL